MGTSLSLPAGVQQMSWDMVKLDKDGNPTGLYRVTFKHQSWFTTMRVRLALWLASDILTVR